MSSSMKETAQAIALASLVACNGANPWVVGTFYTLGSIAFLIYIAVAVLKR